MFGFIKKFKNGFLNTKNKILSGIGGLFSKTVQLSNEEKSALEKILYEADFGIDVVEKIMSELEKAKKLSPNSTLSEIVKNTLADILRGSDECSLNLLEKPQIIMLVGINGAGKTTTAAKLANLLQKNGKNVLIGSCDTFRVAADSQLKTWAERLSINCVGSHKGADAASVAYDACAAGISRNCDYVVLDTAGRLHNKTNLIEELKKIARVLKKFKENFPQHKWLVVDGSLGTNSLAQAKIFHEAIGLTGIIITKLDGSSKGGAIVGIYNSLKIPIAYVGLGENPEDLIKFSTTDYINSILE